MNDGQCSTGNLEHEIIVKSGNVLNGVVDDESGLALPGDKSISHRAILLSALAEGESHVKNILISGVTRVMINGLEQLGVKIYIDEHTLHMQGNGLRGFQKSLKRINCGNSATTLRLLAGAAAASGAPTILDGSEGLRLRPMQRIVDPLRLMGVDVTSADGRAPLEIRCNNHPLKPIEYTMPVASAQVKSCILLAGLAVEGVVIIKEPCHSRDHTERMLISMGLNLQKGYDQREQLYLTRMSVRQPVKLNPLKYIIPGDISAAAFLIVAATIVPGSKVILRHVLLNPTRTGLIDTLNEMGADIQTLNLQEKNGEPIGDLLIKHSKLHCVQVSGSRVVRMIDEFPVFAVAAAVANGKTIVREAGELRLKESDRISSLCEELRNLGVNALEYPDGFEIDGGTALVGGHVDPHRDHRLAMAMSIAGLVSEQPVRVQNSEIIQESFPNFVQIMQNLGADIKLRTNH